jgi:hypothetical protein
MVPNVKVAVVYDDVCAASTGSSKAVSAAYAQKVTAINPAMTAGYTIFFSMFPSSIGKPIVDESTRIVLPT